MAAIQCIICKTPCVWCKWVCKCGMNKTQAPLSNTIIESDNDILSDASKVLLLINAIKKWVKDIDKLKLIIAWEETIENATIRVISSKPIPQAVNNLCEYEKNTWTAWDKCKLCGQYRFYQKKEHCLFKTSQ